MKKSQTAAVVICGAASAALVSGLVAFGVQSNSAASTPQSSVITGSSHPSVDAIEDGKQLFRGIVFGEGATARALGTHASLSTFYSEEYSRNNTPDKINRADTIIDNIAARDPQYFAQFGNAVRSGNPFLVASAIDGVEPQLRAENVALDSVQSDLSQASIVDTNFHINFNVHTNVNVALNENVAIKVNIVRGHRSVPSTKDEFQRESMVADITTALER